MIDLVLVTFNNFLIFFCLCTITCCMFYVKSILFLLTLLRSLLTQPVINLSNLFLWLRSHLCLRIIYPNLFFTIIIVLCKRFNAVEINKQISLPVVCFTLILVNTGTLDVRMSSTSAVRDAVQVGTFYSSYSLVLSYPLV